jgi:hypothetical protein
MDNEEGKSGSQEMTMAQASSEERRPDPQAIAGPSRGDVDETRRILIRAGWVLPAVIAVQLPTATDAFASSIGVTVGAHVDAQVHIDV